tara:strand:- start:22 stop:864 length:843 start_codon:yes stop_codon:yes gene_type:complete
MLKINSILKNSNSNQSLSFTIKADKNKVLKIFRKDLDRSLQSINKQIEFTDKNLLSVAIDNVTCSSKKITIEMPFIEGISGSDIFAYGEFSLLKKLKQDIVSFIENNIKKSKIEKLEFEFFKKKINSVYLNTDDQELRSLIHEVEFKLKKENFDNLSFLYGNCHGDLTFSNMICNEDNKVILFDFLSTFYESPFQDLSKLRQELDYLWSLRFSNKGLITKAKIVNQFFYEGALVKIYKKYEKEINIFSLMTLIRIAPYISDRLTKNWLIKSIIKELSRLE